MKKQFSVRDLCILTTMLTTDISVGCTLQKDLFFDDQNFLMIDAQKISSEARITWSTKDGLGNAIFVWQKK